MLRSAYITPLVLLAVTHLQSSSAESLAGVPPMREVLNKAVPNGKAQIVFYRASAFVGTFMGCNVFSGDRKIAGLNANRYMLLEVEPGFHSFAASESGRAPFQLQIGQGERKFVKCDFGGGIMARNASLIGVSDNAFAKVADKLKPVN